jgi:hypothetical protein
MTDPSSFSSPIFERARNLALRSSLPTFAAERRALAYEGHPGEIKPPKRGAGRESFSDTLNSLGRVVQDALAEANGGSFREAWRMYLAIFGSNCYLCGLPFGTERALTVQADHIYPPKEGGAGAPGNMAGAHCKCNDAKGDLPVDIYLADQPEQLAKIKVFMALYGFEPNPESWVATQSIVQKTREFVEHEVHLTKLRFDKKRAGDDAAADELLEVESGRLSPLSKILLRHTEAFMEAEHWAASARPKMSGAVRRILVTWDEHTPLLSLAEASEDGVRSFLGALYAALPGSRDAVDRTNRAFRLLAEVLNSATLRKIGMSLPTPAGVEKSYSLVNGARTARANLFDLVPAPQEAK